MSKLEELISQLTSTEALELRRKLALKPKKTQRISFPPESKITTFGETQTCISKLDALRILGEFLLQDVDKMGNATIKARAVDALASLAEVEDLETEKRNTLMRAANIVMEIDRTKLLSKIASLATIKVF